MQTLKLNNGVEMPVAGYGVFQIQNQKLSVTVDGTWNFNLWRYNIIEQIL